jgi:flagellar protein FliO/FliZ
MDALFGTTMPLAARFFIAFLVVLALIGVTAWLVRRFGANRLGAASRGRQPRLAVIDAASVDGRRRLVLIRRDNTEHLLMIGGPTDVVIEPNIVRASGARDIAREPGRLSTSLDAGARVGVAPPPEPAWQPSLSELPAPAAPPPPRSFRTPATEEPWLPPEPGGRARPSESLTGLAAELSAKLHSPEVAVPQPRHEPPAPARHEPPAPVRHEPAAAVRHEPAPPRTIAPPVTPEQPAAMPPPATQNDHNLAEMAQQLEAALRRAPAPEGRPPVTDPLAAPPPAKPVAPQGAPRDIKPKVDAKREAKLEPPTIERRPEQRFESRPEAKPEPKFDPKFDAKPEPRFEFRPERRPEPASTPSKTIYDNLEEEMASLLGRPPDKS